MSRNEENTQQDMLPMDAEGNPMPSPHRAVGSPISDYSSNYPNERNEGTNPHQDVDSPQRQPQRRQGISQENVDFLYAHHAGQIREQRGLPSYEDFANGNVEAPGSRNSTPASNQNEQSQDNNEVLSTEIAAKVDAGDDDDFARLSNTVAASAQDTLPETKSLPQAESQAFSRLADGFHLPPQQAGAIVSQIADYGQIGSQLAGSIRSHLASLPTRSGTPLSEANINRAVQALERAAERLAVASSDSESGEQLDMAVTSGKPTIVTPISTQSEADD
jgi:hypothetical protein